MMKTRKRIRFADSPVYIYIIYDVRQLLQILESSSSNEKNIVRTKPAVVLYILILLPVNEAEGCWLTPRVKKELEAGERGWSPPGGRGTSLTHEK